jgi:hypothetical protein
MPGKKIRAAITSEKNFVQANSKVQIVLKKFYTPLPGFLMVPPKLVALPNYNI